MRSRIRGKRKMFDTMKIEILKDGTIKTTTDAISPANHDNAEEFLAAMARLSGGATERVGRDDRNPHVHHHGDVDHHHHH
jgi:hypothetical protein